MEEAVEAAQLAVENFETLPNTPFKEFAIETYNAIKGK
jgi:hypothetical protein